MGQEFRITITAADKASEVIDQINAKMDRLVLPIERTQKAANLLDKEKGLSNAGRAIWKMGEAAFTTEKRIGGMVNSVLGITGKIGVAGGVAGAAGVAIYAANKFGQFGFEIDRTSRLLGISERDLQRYRLAAEMTGISQEKMTSAVRSFGLAAQDAQWGRNPAALMALNQLNVAIQRTPTGAIDTFKMLRDVIKVLGDKNVPVQTKEIAAATLGLSELLPVIVDGSVKFDELLRKVDESGAVMSDKGVKSAKMMRESLFELELQVKALGNALKEDLIQWLEPATRWLSSALPGFTKFMTTPISETWQEASQGMARAAKNPGGHLQRMGRGSAQWVPDAPNAWSLGWEKTSKSIMDQLVDLGWSPEQAAGMAANIKAESSGNPGAVGDRGKAYGLAQWHPDRQANFARVMGKDIRGSSVSEQVAFMDWELRNTEKKAGDMLANARTKEDAAAIFSRYYERPGDVAGEAFKRRSIASQIPLQSGGGAEFGPSTPASGSPGKITVDVNFQNAPPGTQVRNYVEGPVSANTRIGYSNPGTL